MKLLIVEGDTVFLEIDDVEKIATVKADTGVALSPELRTLLCAYFIDGIVPKTQTQAKPKSSIIRFPDYALPVSS